MADTDVTAEAIVADAEAAAETLQQVKAEIAKACSARSAWWSLPSPPFWLAATPC